MQIAVRSIDSGIHVGSAATGVRHRMSVPLFHHRSGGDSLLLPRDWTDDTASQPRDELASIVRKTTIR